MALKLKTALENLYKKAAGIPKTEVKTQGKMIREEWTKSAGLGYQGKSALLNAVNLRDNNFRPKGGVAPHLAQDIVGPLVNSTQVGRIATEQVFRTQLGSNTYADFDRMTDRVNVKSHSLKQRFNLDYKNESNFNVDVNGNPETDLYADIIPVTIGVYQFRGVISGLTDNSTPSWTGTSYAGRPDQIYNYNGVERTLSFNLRVYATSNTDLVNMYSRVEKIYNLTRPSAGEGDTIGDSTRLNAPITRVRIGNFINESSILTGLTVTPVEELSWEINDPDKDYPSKTLSARYGAPSIQNSGTSQPYVVPRALDLSLNFTILHDEVPATFSGIFKPRGDV